jgi:Flp pilus assembly protein TadG
MKGAMRAGTRPHGSRHSQCGQSLVETAICAPLLLALVLGTLNLGVYVNDMISAGTASRQGARLAALLGGGKHVSPTPLTSDYDRQIVQDVQAGTSTMAYATVTEIDIYRPTTNADGSYAPVGDLADEYNGNGSPRSKQTFPLSGRNQTLPNETSIGVRVVWSYQPVSRVGFPATTASQYTVFRSLAVP